jgi:predicted alpha-1,6-mannanase (GH76 family)
MRYYITIRVSVVASFTWLVTSSRAVLPRQSSTIYAQNARTAIEELQKSYDPSTGLYNGLWWNSANVITMLADFQEYLPSYISDVNARVFPTTLTVAPQSSGFGAFLNSYYDDELWWALAWIKVYDVTQDAKYLDMASNIFEDAKSSWGSSPCGGLW